MACVVTCHYWTVWGCVARNKPGSLGQSWFTCDLNELFGGFFFVKRTQLQDQQLYALPSSSSNTILLVGSLGCLQGILCCCFWRRELLVRNTVRENGLLFEDSAENCWCGALGGVGKSVE